LPCIVSDNPYAYYARVAQLLNPPPPTPAGIIRCRWSESQLRSERQRRAGAFIGKDVSVGEHCVIGPGCIIGDGVRLGAGSGCSMATSPSTQAA
jgi:UDP-3-O-[3-hydroxymyristoyl] glucosamine N-acyltransferase